MPSSVLVGPFSWTLLLLSWCSGGDVINMLKISFELTLALDTVPLTRHLGVSCIRGALHIVSLVPCHCFIWMEYMEAFQIMCYCVAPPIWVNWDTYQCILKIILLWPLASKQWYNPAFLFWHCNRRMCDIVTQVKTSDLVGLPLLFPSLDQRSASSAVHHHRVI